MTLKEQAFSGVKWTTISSIVVAVVFFIQNIILARVLSHADYGLISLLLVIIGFANIFIDMGINNAIIYKQNISHNQLSSLYWLSIFSGTIFFIVTFLASPLIAAFYNKPEMQPYIFYISLIFIISSISRQFRILLQKNLDFVTISKIEMIASVISFAFCLLWIYLYRNIYAFIAATILSNIIQSILLIIKGIKIHKPGFIYKQKEIKELLAFGRFQLGERSLGYFISQLDTIMIGKIFNLEILGIYSIAKTLAYAPIQFITPIVGKVSLPVMAKIQNNDVVLKQIFLKTVRSMCSMIFPVYFFMALLSSQILSIVYGVKGEHSVTILILLSFTYLIRSIGVPNSSLVLAKGRADLGFYVALFMAAFYPIVIYISSFWGINSIGAGLLISQFIIHMVIYYFVIKPVIPIRFMEYNTNYFKLLFISIAITLISMPILFLHINIYWQTGIIGIIGAAGFSIAYYFMNKEFLGNLTSLKNVN